MDSWFIGCSARSVEAGTTEMGSLRADPAREARRVQFLRHSQSKRRFGQELELSSMDVLM